jgi:hypothetical protein
MKYALMLFAIALSGCTVKETVVEKAAAPTTLSTTANAITVAPATPEQCSGGGAVYTLFIDANSNGVREDSEVVMNEQLICNGSSGSIGFSTLFSMTRVSTGLEACASGSGLQINTGIDSNRSSTLEASEIIGSQVLCDGAKGETGATGSTGSAGAAGSNGYNMVFQSTQASSEQCFAGGSVVVMALDTNRNGHYDPSDSNASTVTLCNGVNGSNGSNGTNGTNAVVPAYTPVAPIYPCGKTVAFKEVLLRLQNGEILSSFSDNSAGSMTRLTFLPDGSYLDTDDSSCQFSIATSSDKQSRSISWGGQVQQSWALSN